MLTRFQLAQNLNKEYADLYGDSIKEYVEMPATTTFEDIIKQVRTNTIIGYKHYLMVAGRCVIAFRKYTWSGRVAKTSYLHIIRVNNFKDQRVIEYYREQKDGSFKTI